MRRIITICLLIPLVFSSLVYTQWEKVYNNNTWSNGVALYTHGNILFQTGYGGNMNHILRSSDNGINWTDISSSFPYTVYNVLSVGNNVFGVTTTLGTTVYSFYESTDNGVSWTEKSSIDRGAGNGAILSMASDGINLFAVSNRRSIYKSTDGGSVWSELLINYPGTSGILSFAASGNTYLTVLEGVGCLVSTDSGINWSLKNPASPLIEVYKMGSDIWALGSGFSGIYKYNISTNVWENNYSPSTFSMPISIGSNGTKLISTFGDFLTGNRKYYSSSDFGVNWIELTIDTIGLNNNITSRYAVTANSSYFFAGSWLFSNSTISYSVYRLPITTTDVKSEINNPILFQLTQNYPNPFNPSTKIRYTIPNVTLSGVEGSRVQLKIFDVLGNEITTLVNEYKPAGQYEVNFDASQLSSGIYFYTLQVIDPESRSGQGFVETKKMILLK